jgi:hypothetical protein
MLPGQREGEGKVPREKRLMAFASEFTFGVLLGNFGERQLDPEQ